jgi:biotin operon repressor
MHLAAIDSSQQMILNQIDIFRDAINEHFRRLRIQLGLPAVNGDERRER